MEFIYAIMEKLNQSSLLSMTPSQLCWDNTDLMSYPALRNCSLYFVRLRFMFLRVFNKLVAKLLPYVDLRQNEEFGTLAHLLKENSIFLFTKIKLDFFEKIFDLTAEHVSPTPRITINRIRLAEQELDGTSGDFIAKTNFGIGMAQIRDLDPFTLPTLHSTCT